MRLSELITDPALKPEGGDPEILGITSDSREVRPGFLFAALPGGKIDRAQFLADAARAGALAVLVPAGVEAPAGVARVVSKNPRADFARMAAAFYARQMPVIAAVTGTNGKSSTVNFCRQLWAAQGHAAASMGTLGLIAPGVERPGSLTTPDPVTLFSEVAELEAAGVTHLALEASSQGLDQCRMTGLNVGIGAFTNLTRDHLDYHGSMEKYFDAKMRLFTEIVPKGGAAVINDESDHAEAVRNICKAQGLRIAGYGATGREIKLIERRPLPEGQFIRLDLFGRIYDVELPLVGDFQASNVLCALGIALDAGAVDPAAAVAALSTLKPVRGRLELAARHPKGGAVYVDYAHTPDGLETMLRAIRPHAQGALRVVFGCGGDRDRGKRPLMGGIAVRLSDQAIVTDDNPRTEQAAAIRAEVMAGAQGAVEVGGRAAAIRAGVAAMQPGDILVIAGKGHEQGQIVGTEVLPFDDVTVARQAVEEIAA